MKLETKRSCLAYASVCFVGRPRLRSQGSGPAPSLLVWRLRFQPGAFVLPVETNITRIRPDAFALLADTNITRIRPDAFTSLPSAFVFPAETEITRIQPCAFTFGLMPSLPACRFRSSSLDRHRKDSARDRPQSIPSLLSCACDSFVCLTPI